MPGQRLDRWLWCARLVKTRSGAVRLIADGKVRVNGIRALKPSRLVHEGDVVTAMVLGRLAVLRVCRCRAAGTGEPCAHALRRPHAAAGPRPGCGQGDARGRGRPSATAGGSMRFATAIRSSG